MKKERREYNMIYIYILYIYIIITLTAFSQVVGGCYTPRQNWPFEGMLNR